MLLLVVPAVIPAVIPVTADTYQNFNYAILIQINYNSSPNVPVTSEPPPSSPSVSAPSNLNPPIPGSVPSPEPAVCPTNTISCRSIGAPEYCCNKADYCARDSANRIGCCPWGSYCQGVAPDAELWADGSEYPVSSPSGSGGPVIMTPSGAHVSSATSDIKLRNVGFMGVDSRVVLIVGLVCIMLAVGF
jgi:hypothetical protein